VKNLKLAFICFSATVCLSSVQAGRLIKDRFPLVNLLSVLDTEKIQVKVAYSSPDNFTGKKLLSYPENICYLSREAAVALKKINAELNKRNYALRLHDCYRPYRASQELYEWARVGAQVPVTDQIRRWRYFNNPLLYFGFKYSPDPLSSELNILGRFRSFELLNLQLIAPAYLQNGIHYASRHASGSTVDVSLLKILHGKDGKVSFEEVPMGTEFDSFESLSDWSAQFKDPQINKNREILRQAMNSRFRPYQKEWWHWTLRGEPFRDQYFNCPVQSQITLPCR